MNTQPPPYRHNSLLTDEMAISIPAIHGLHLTSGRITALTPSGPVTVINGDNPELIDALWAALGQVRLGSASHVVVTAHHETHTIIITTVSQEDTTAVSLPQDRSSRIRTPWGTGH